MTLEKAPRAQTRLHGCGRTPRLYRFCDGLTEGLVYWMAVFCPWAFGTTQPWAIWTMNVTGYVLGAALVSKWMIRWRTGYQPPRWGDGRTHWPVRLLAGLTILLVAWCLVAALNARAAYLFQEMRLEYRDSYIPWLPHSYHAPGSWFAFWQYLGLAWTFWALRDWLLGKTRRERGTRRGGEAASLDAGSGEASEIASATSNPTHASPQIPARLRRLLWVLCLNGGLLALEGILQRSSGTNKLLWLIVPRLNTTPESQFGPYAYRSNAAQYFNLLWPVALGFWWSLRAAAKQAAATVRLGSGAHVVLPMLALVMAACPVVSESRAGAAVTAVNVVLVGAVLLFASRRYGRTTWALLGAFVLLTAVGGVGGWQILKVRMQEYSWPTGREEPVTAFTLRCLLRMPDVQPGDTVGIVGLSEQRRQLHALPRSTMAVIRPEGRLDVLLYGEGMGMYWHYVSNFFNQHAGALVDLTIVKSTNVTVYTNGEALPGIENYDHRGLLLTNRFASAHLWVGTLGMRSHNFPGRIFAVGFLDVALSAAQIKATTADLTALAAAERTPTDPWGKAQSPAAVLFLGTDQLEQTRPLSDQLFDRLETYRNARQMLRDHPFLGTGPGTFGPLYNLYRGNTQETWHWYLHNDWMEVLVTFGGVGGALLLAALLAAVLQPFVGGGIVWSQAQMLCVWLALVGCLAHAVVDFPLQIYSVLHLFLVLCCLCTVAGYRKRKACGLAISGWQAAQA